MPDEINNTPSPAASQQPAGTSGLAVAGLVLTILGLLGSFVPLLNILSAPFAILGLILAAVGLAGINKGKHTGKGVAIAGVVMGIVALVVTVAMYATAGAVTAAAANDPEVNAAIERAADEAVDEAVDEVVGEAGEAAADSEPAADTAGESAAESEPAADTAAEADYVVTIDDCVRSTDYANEPAIAVTYTWTNNSDDATDFIVALRAKAFQNGVELESGIGVEGADSSAAMAEIKPGATQTVTMGYKLADDSDVTVEVSETFDFSKKGNLAERTFSLG